MVRHLALDGDAFSVPGTLGDVHVLVRARDGRLAVAPLGSGEHVEALWRDCGVIGCPQDDPLAGAVHAAWSGYWQEGGAS